MCLLGLRHERRFTEGREIVETESLPGELSICFLTDCESR